MEEAHRVAHIGPNQLPAVQKLMIQRLGVQHRLMVQVFKQDVLHLHGPAQPLPQPVLVKQVAHLNARLGILIRIEGRDAALGGAKRLAAQALLLIPILEHVIGHEQLGPLRHDQVGGGHALLHNAAQLVHQLDHV